MSFEEQENVADPFLLWPVKIDDIFLYIAKNEQRIDALYAYATLQNIRNWEQPTELEKIKADAAKELSTLWDVLIEDLKETKTSAKLLTSKASSLPMAMIVGELLGLAHLEFFDRLLEHLPSQ